MVTLEYQRLPREPYKAFACTSKIAVSHIVVYSDIVPKFLRLAESKAFEYVCRIPDTLRVNGLRPFSAHDNLDCRGVGNWGEFLGKQWSSSDPTAIISSATPVTDDSSVWYCASAADRELVIGALEAIYADMCRSYEIYMESISVWRAEVLEPHLAALALAVPGDAAATILRFPGPGLVRAAKRKVRHITTAEGA